MGRRFVAQALVLALIALEGCATTPECAGILLPPPNLAGPPPFPFKETWLPAELVGEHCFTLGTAEHDRIACSRAVPALIMLPEVNGRDVTRITVSCLRDHEFGHLNDPEHRTDHKGWPMS